jgi:hypothetical protein
MKIRHVLFIAACLTLSSGSVFTQAPSIQKRTITKTDRFDFGAGGTVAILGAPNGSIRVVGTATNEIEITAKIEIQAGNEEDLAKLSEATGFATDESNVRVGIMSIGTHNKFGLKKLPKQFPKNLLGLPFKIDYVINVPRYCDLEIDGGKGDLSVSGVEGSLRVNYLETNAHIEVVTGTTSITVGSGMVDVAFGVSGWRGRSANIQIAKGDLNVRLPTNLSAEIDAVILRTGSIESTLPDLKPRDRKVQFTEKSIIAKAGVGGAPLKFTVGDGHLKLERLVLPL